MVDRSIPGIIIPIFLLLLTVCIRKKLARPWEQAYEMIRKYRKDPVVPSF
jgi:hypothetical protein